MSLLRPKRDTVGIYRNQGRVWVFNENSEIWNWNSCCSVQPVVSCVTVQDSDEEHRSPAKGQFLFFLGALFLETCRVPLISHVYFFQGRSHKFQVLNRIFACYFWSSVESWRWCNWTVVVLPRLRSLPAAPRKAPPGAASAALRRRQQLCRARHQTGAAAGALLQRCHVDLVGGQPLAEKASPR